MGKPINLVDTRHSQAAELAALGAGSDAATADLTRQLQHAKIEIGELQDGLERAEQKLVEEQDAHAALIAGLRDIIAVDPDSPLPVAQVLALLPTEPEAE
jgi:hypothetical protein